jgi:hypothetical protein
MSRYTKGARVVAVRQIRGYATDGNVPKGSRGVVTQGGLGVRAKVEFTRKGFLGGDSKVVIDVDDNAVERV